MYDNTGGMTAHIRKSDKKYQHIKEHLNNTAKLCFLAAKELKLDYLAQLIGKLHDMGKCTENFTEYLEIQNGIKKGYAVRGEIHHSPAGAIYAYEHWYNNTIEQKMTAQIIAMVIFAHHSGFMDVLTLSGESPLSDALKRDKNQLHYEEAVGNFLTIVAGTAELDELFLKAVDDIKGVIDKLKSQNSMSMMICGLIAREMLSILVDSDRYDSACFEYDCDPFQKEPPTDWSPAIEALEKYLSEIPIGKLSGLRNEISDVCYNASNSQDKIFRLTIPTGGGKTFSSLRFALNYAKTNHSERIFYIIPFNTILDQNAKDIRIALKDTLRILEHHSNVVFENENISNEIENYRILTERWTGIDLILTSMVQFMECFYSRQNSDARRMCRLSKSVIIFDEIQALPKKCINLFEKAIDFLTAVCGCTVVLCTATQPELEFKLPIMEMFPHPERLFYTLRRTQLVDETAIALTTDAAIAKSKELLCRYGAVLFIVNTKAMAKEIYDGIKSADVTALHLSTDMFPAHRLEILDNIKNSDRNKPLFCVSTALIEAGINISFPCVIRSLAGMSSIIQASGRCNRNSELPDGTYGHVYIWKLADENLGNLKEIEISQQISEGILKKYGSEADTIPAIRNYFVNEKNEFNSCLNFPVNDKNKETTIIDLLGINKDSGNHPARSEFVMHGGYRTAGEYFKVIDQNTVSVLAACSEGENIYLKLCRDPPMDEKIRLLRKAALYSVSVYSDKFKRLCDNDAIITLDNTNIYILRKEFYSSQTGVSEKRVPYDYLEY